MLPSSFVAFLDNSWEQSGAFQVISAGKSAAADGGLRTMIAKKLIVIAIPLAIPLAVAGYLRHTWSEDQQRWAAARDAAELRYAQMIDLNCQLGELTDSTACARALNDLAGRMAFVSRSMAELEPPPTLRLSQAGLWFSD
jgi:hypothetical protein